jgi:hypothetical protein
MNDEKSKIWDYLIDNDIAKEETLRIVTSINGYNEKSLNDILYAVTGYRNIKQIYQTLFQFYT